MATSAKKKTADKKSISKTASGELKKSDVLNADPVILSGGEQMVGSMICEAAATGSGNVGWAFRGKVVVKLADGRSVSCQGQVYLTAIKSVGWKD